VVKKDVEAFTNNKSRVLKGAKEARWNNKYMKIIEKPVKQVELATNLVEIQMVIIALLKSLYNIYQNSNFYKEARIVSFVDRLLGTIKAKIKAKLNLQSACYMAIRDYPNFQEQIEHARSICTKFVENFFIKDLMDQSNKVATFLSQGPEEEKKQAYNENSEEA